MSENLRLGDEIGRGALGRVVRVYDEGGQSGAVYAGKLLHDSQKRDPTAMARFRAEASILKDLIHPNLVQVYGLVELDGSEIVLMELIQGPGLNVIIACEDPLPPERVIALARGIAAGLAAAHHAGLIHRDLKPANVLVAPDDQAKIVDFGMARATSLAGVDASASALVGTPDYMAPEAIDPLAVDVRSDLYSLGCILCELLTGRPPYAAPTAFALLEAHRSAPIPDFVDMSSGTRAHPPALIALTRALLAKSPADRPQSAAAVVQALDSLGTGSAMVLAEAGAGAGEGQCAQCGQPLVALVPVCFECGAMQPRLDPGDFTLLVVGPGDIADKLDTELRLALLDWLRKNPGLGLDPAPLAKRVPRLPFVLASQTSQPSAQSLATALAALGLQCEVTRGGSFALSAMRKKAWRLGGRLSLIALGSGISFLHVSPLILLPAAGAAMVGAVGGGWLLARQRATSRTRRSDAQISAELAERLDRVAGVLPAIAERRHRHNLRAVVQRVLSLRQSLSPAHRADADADLCELLDLAVVASCRIDELDAELGAGDLRNLGTEARAMLHERDAWSARLLEVTAFIDALRARYAALATAVPASASPGGELSLADLRAHIEALAELRKELP